MVLLVKIIAVESIYAYFRIMIICNI